MGGAAQDFHTSIAGAMTDDEYVRELYSAMLEDAQQELQAGTRRAAQRCVKKAELKVSMSLHCLLYIHSSRSSSSWEAHSWEVPCDQA